MRRSLPFRGARVRDLHSIFHLGGARVRNLHRYYRGSGRGTVRGVRVRDAASLARASPRASEGVHAQQFPVAFGPSPLECTPTN